MGAAVLAPTGGGTGGSSSAGPGDPAGEQAAGIAARRLLAASGGYVAESDAHRLRLGVLERRRPLIERLADDVSRESRDRLWAALGLGVPELLEVPDADLVFDPRDPRPLVELQLMLLEEAAGEAAAALEERSERIDWGELAVFVALPIVGRGAFLGRSLLQIPGGLTLPPIIAVLAQAHADARVD
jgi:hypothetical protein